MWGLNFETANNSLICGNCVFECQYRDEKISSRKFRLDMQPDRWTFEEYHHDDGKLITWKTITYGKRELVLPVVESILPKKKDYDKDWNWQQFLVALTFFDKGVNSGKSKANSDTEAQVYCHPQVYCQEWEESEQGWGVRSDGYSLHLTMGHVKAYIENFWQAQKAFSPEVPHEYSRPSGSPYFVEVTPEIYKAIKGSENGISYDGRAPKRVS